MSTATIAEMLGEQNVAGMQALAAYRFASWLYYVGDERYPSPLTDADYDELQAALGASKTEAHTIKLTPLEQGLAMRWSQQNT